MHILLSTIDRDIVLRDQSQKHIPAVLMGGIATVGTPTELTKVVELTITANADTLTGVRDISIMLA